MKAWLAEILVVLAIVGVIVVQQKQARADFITQAGGGHGPFNGYTNPLTDRGQVMMMNPNPPFQIELWTGDMSPGYYTVRSAIGATLLAMSPTYTFAIAYEFEVRPNSFAGRNVVLSPNSWTVLSWVPAAVVVTYYPPCPTDQAASFTTVHVCTGAYTPMDGGGKPTVIIQDAFGNALKLPGNTNHVECEAHLPNYPNLARPGGLPDDVAAVYTGSCP